MKQVKIKSGGEVIILSKGELPPLGAITFLDHEFDWAKNIAYGYRHDPESVSSFWKTIIEKKKGVNSKAIYILSSFLMCDLIYTSFCFSYEKVKKIACMTKNI